LRDVLAHDRPELEPFGVSAAGDPHVRHVWMPIHNEVATRADLVVTRVRLQDRRILEQWKPVRDESTRPLDARRLSPAIACVRVELLWRRVWRGSTKPSAAPATSASVRGGWLRTRRGPAAGACSAGSCSG
jgi:hypothetical protein